MCHFERSREVSSTYRSTESYELRSVSAIILDSTCKKHIFFNCWRLDIIKKRIKLIYEKRKHI